MDIIFLFILGQFFFPRPRNGAALMEEMARARYLCEFRFIRSLLQRGAHLPVASKADPPSPGGVLVPLSPYRIDHHSLIYPVTNMLADRGVNSVILVSRQLFRPDVDRQLFRGSLFLFAEDFLTTDVYRRARKLYGRLTPWLSKLSSVLRFDSERRRRTHILFQNYCMDKEIFADVLAFTRPSVTYGLHFIQNPGYLAAIDEIRANGSFPKKLLIQHGAFACEDFHDFKGADCVILWGEHFHGVLSTYRLTPVPDSKVLGNPKLEILPSKRKVLSETYHPASGKGIVLFLSTPDCPGADYNTRALHIFAECAHKRLGHYRVLYKPHPGENPGSAYRPLFQEGFIMQDQMVDRVSSVYGLIEQADVVVGGHSTVLPEAAALGIPVIQILPAMSGTDWVQQGMLGASTEQELSDRVQAILTNPEYRRTVLAAQQGLAEKMFGTLEGSSERIADYIVSLL
jgi:hypothetical protein